MTTGLLATVRSKISGACIVTALNKEGCRIRLDGVPSSRLIMDFDKPDSPLAQDQVRCDYLLLAEIPDAADQVFPIELKRGNVDASVAIGRLQAGACIAERLIPTEFDIQLLPVLASGGVRKAERKEMRGKVQFRKDSRLIRRIRCGAPLPNP